MPLTSTITNPNSAYGIPTSTYQIEDYLTSHQNTGDPVVAIDTETTGLNIRQCKLVGISISAKPATGLYIPIGHEVGNYLNMPIMEVIEALISGIGERESIFWNAKYDLSVLKRNTGWTPKKWFDAPALAYLDNSDRRIGLKFMAEAILGIVMDHFEDIFDDPTYLARFGKTKRTKSVPLLVQYLPPLKVLDYASSDADFTLRLYNHFRFIRDVHPGPLKVDHALVPVLQRMELLGGLEVYEPYIQEQVNRLDALSAMIEQDIWETAGYQFDIRSPKQVGNLLYMEMGIPVTEKTATGKPSTNATTLSKLTQYPIVERMIVYKKLQTARSSYFNKLAYVVEKGMKPYFTFNQYRVPTYRLASSGGDPDKDGTLGINIQSVSNGETRDTYGVDVSENFHILNHLGAYLYVLPNEKKDEGDAQTYTCIKATCDNCFADCPTWGIDTKRVMTPDVRVVPSVRQALQAPDGYVLLSFDYDRQEIVIVTNLSGEPVWEAALKAGKDIHLATAESIWGSMDGKPKKVIDQLRRMAKVINFGILYGMSASGIALRLGVPKQEGEDILDKYFKGMQGLKKWLDTAAHVGVKLGYALTFWKRKRWVDHIIANDQLGHAKRVAMNTPIQGTGAEVTRIAMVRCDGWLQEFDPTFTRARMVITLHDEIGVIAKIADVQEVAEGIREAMEFTVPKWTIQLKVGVKAGRIWGKQKELDWDAPLLEQIDY